MRVAITGGTGFIGRRLAESLAAGGYSVNAVGREREPGEADAIVNLGGEPIAQRWTREAKKKIRESRIMGTRRLVQALSQLEKRPGVLVSASAIGYYGNRGDEILTEASAPASGFLAELCKEWEREAEAAEPLGIRVVRLRIGVVLGAGGALARMLPPFKMGVGGRLGSGKQWMSWIHIDDVAGLIRFALEQPLLQGPVNATAPNPVTNAEFTGILARALGRPAFMPVPAVALKTLFGEMSSVLLDSQRVLPRAAESAGYSFKFPELAGALNQILTK
jgi:hypothetical protein